MDKFLSMLEKAVRAQFFLLATSFLFFLDSVATYFSGVGIRDIVQGGGRFDMSLALEVALIFVAFSGLISLVLPTLMVTVILFYIDIQYGAWKIYYNAKRNWLGIKDAPFNRQRGQHNCVRPTELLREAHAKESKFLIDRYEEYERSEQESRAAQREIQVYAFCALIFLAFNSFLPGSYSNHTITNWVVSYCGASFPVWIAIGIFCWLVVLPVHQDDTNKRWLYCPPLYEKLEAEEEQRRKAEQEWEKKMGFRRQPD
ncbi:hypothetical protein [Paraburkholderia phenoliruptrix]|uniref:hypothetical protein n=1 Tax=Paraburkholderia phenoliruptrix TaxID=252970 RepID=UPI0028670EC2|nr:hypothetical protein [Paraburkholderia phenoliruptrix]MDR6388429.1 hypothetical protein [Paraburkholderia phenoliruptrix]WMY07447.1 hypothetical protein P3F88_14395 [Paraburkholderia phenoliruptrix]